MGIDGYQGRSTPRGGTCIFLRDRVLIKFAKAVSSRGKSRRSSKLFCAEAATIVALHICAMTIPVAVVEIHRRQI